MHQREQIQSIAQELMTTTEGIVAIGEDIMPMRRWV